MNKLLIYGNIYHSLTHFICIFITSLFQPQHYGLSDDFDGCKPCDCDIGGAYDNDCDVISGQCKCKKNFSGRRCDTAENSFYCANIDHYTYEAENAQITYVSFNSNTVYNFWVTENFYLSRKL